MVIPDACRKACDGCNDRRINWRYCRQLEMACNGRLMRSGSFVTHGCCEQLTTETGRTKPRGRFYDLCHGIDRTEVPLRPSLRAVAVRQNCVEFIARLVVGKGGRTVAEDIHVLLHRRPAASLWKSRLMDVWPRLHRTVGRLAVGKHHLASVLLVSFGLRHQGDCALPCRRRRNPPDRFRPGTFPARHSKRNPRWRAQ